MRTTAFISALALVATSVSAGPTPRGYGGYGGDKHGDEDCEPVDPFFFTSKFNVIATPGQVVNGTTPTGGLTGAIGYYNFGINSMENVICYNITLYGFKGNYSSPALTATHIHQGAKGASGPPRLAFPNPTIVDATKPEGKRVSYGCLTGPFLTGILVNGTDTGTGFKVASIEANPSGFFADVHSSMAVPGAVRGQLS